MTYGLPEIAKDGIQRVDLTPRSRTKKAEEVIPGFFI
jgi:hypothetical protein